MNPGELKTVLSFKTVTSVVTNGDTVETAGIAVNIRCKLRQLEGFKKMQYTELLTKEVYEAICYDNAVIKNDAICTSGSDILTIYSVVKNTGKSGTNEVKIILYKK